MALNPGDLLSRLMSPGANALILEIDLDRGVLQAVPENPLQMVRAINSPTMGTLTEALRKAASDERVRGLVVHVGSCPLSAAQVDELGCAIADFGASKPTVAYAESFGEMTSGMFPYRLAAHAQEVWLQPTGAVVLGGAALQILLLRGGLEKLGLEPDFEKRHEYKTGADQLSATEVSDANREMMQRIADSLVEETVRVVAQRRGLDEAEVRAVVDGGPLDAAQARERRLVDRLGYRDEVYAAVRERWGADAQLLYAARYTGSLATRVLDQVTKRHQPTVACIRVHGGIVVGRGVPASPTGGGTAGSETVTEHLRQAAADDDVVAVVLDVDSPGGSYIASDTIWRAVHQVRESGRPVVASMGGLAASGGYYVSMGADEIVAEPSTLTGSIGVYAGKVLTTGLYDKLGLVREGVYAGANASFMSDERRWTDEQRAQVDAWLDAVYDDFTAKAAADRHLAIDELRAIAKGRVWTGADALRHGLVDHLGGREQAVVRACELAGVARDRVEVRAYPALGLLERFRPAESSENPGGTATAGHDLSLEGLLRAAAASAGFGYAGVLSMPWRIRIG